MVPELGHTTHWEHCDGSCGQEALPGGRVVVEWVDVQCCDQGRLVVFPTHMLEVNV